MERVEQLGIADVQIIVQAYDGATSYKWGTKEDKEQPYSQLQHFMAHKLVGSFGCFQNTSVTRFFRIHHNTLLLFLYVFKACT